MPVLVCLCCMQTSDFAIYVPVHTMMVTYPLAALWWFNKPLTLVVTNSNHLCFCQDLVPSLSEYLLWLDQYVFRLGSPHFTVSRFFFIIYVYCILSILLK